MEKLPYGLYREKKEDREYMLLLPHGASLGEAYDVVISFANDLSQQMKDHMERAKKEIEERQAKEKEGKDGIQK